MARSNPVETPGPLSTPPEREQLPEPERAALEEIAVADAADLVGSPDAIDWSHLNQAAAVQPGYLAVDDGLPNYSDVDPAKLTAPVLTKQGWVMPLNDPRARFGGH